MKKLTFRKQLGTLVPDGFEAEEAIQKIPQGSMVMVTVRRPRNIGHHRKLFALLKLVVDNQEHYRTVDHLLSAIKVATGHCDTYPMKDGNTAFIPKSIAFESMDQTAFEEFWDGAVKFIIAKVLPGVDRAALENEILEIVA